MASVEQVFPNGKGLAMEQVFPLDDQALKDLHIQRELMEVPPFNVPARKLQAAYEGILAGKIAYNPLTARWQIEGSKGVPYEFSRDGCSCPNGQNNKTTRFGCWHAVGAELYDRWRKALTPLAPAPLREDAMPSMAEKRRTTQHFVDTMETPAMPVHTPPSDDEYTPEPAPRQDTPQALALLDATEALPPGVVGCVLSHTHIERSEQVALLMTALAKAQAQMGNPAFDAVNPHYRTPYASLAAVRDAITPALTAHGLALTQLLASEPGQVVCTTVLWHSSGQYLSATLRLPVGKPDAQGYGGAITYARRYSLMGFCNVAGDEDEDGERDVGRAAATKSQAGSNGTAPDWDALKTKITALLRDLGLTPKTLQEYETEVFARTGLRLVRENYSAIVERLTAVLAEA